MSLGMMLLALAVSAACSGSGKAAAEDRQTSLLEAPVKADADSLYSLVEAQTSLGPRTPGSEAHRLCRDYLVEQLRAYGVDSIYVQQGEARIFDGTLTPLYNISGIINPDASDRIMLVAHYDTRPWADASASEADHVKAIDGANDGASGVAVILEVARQLQQMPLDSIGVDILFVDLEDSGNSGAAGGEETWCLGSQYWADNHSYPPGRTPRYGILLDMVGGADARFHREYISQRVAPSIVDKVWSVAAASGFADRFPNETGGSVIDDHLFLSRAGIPTIDIIESANPATGSFNPTWHTLDDNLASIDRQSLRTVAQVLLNLLYLEDGKIN